MVELTRVATIENENWEDKALKFISKGKYENRENCEWCGISNGRSIPKFANFWNFDSFPNFQNYENLLIFRVGIKI